MRPGPSGVERSLPLLAWRDVRPLHFGCRAPARKDNFRSGTARCGIRHKENSGDGSVGAAEPSSKFDRSGRQSRREGCLVVPYRPPIAGGGGQRQHRSDVPAPPGPVAAHHAGNNPPFHVEPPEKLVDVPDIRLDLDDEQRLKVGSPGQDVHRAAIAVAVERELGQDDPTARRQTLAQVLDESGVPGIGQPVEITAAPLGCERDRDAENSAILRARARESRRPRSRSDTDCWLAPAAAARSIWRRRFLRRMARTIEPSFTSSTPEACQSPITRGLSVVWAPPRSGPPIQRRAETACDVSAGCRLIHSALPDRPRPRATDVLVDVVIAARPGPRRFTRHSERTQMSLETSFHVTAFGYPAWATPILEQQAAPLASMFRGVAMHPSHRNPCRVRGPNCCPINHAAIDRRDNTGRTAPWAQTRRQPTCPDLADRPAEFPEEAKHAQEPALWLEAA